MKIAIEAQVIRSSSGRYVERLLYYLQEVDRENEYVVILSDKDFDTWQPTAPNFTKLSFNFRRYNALSQFQLARLLYKQKANIVHFTFQPTVFTPFVALLYWKKKLFTVHDLTQLRVKNRKRARIVFETLHWGFKVLIRLNVWSAQGIVVPSNFVRRDVSKYLLYSKKKITVTYESADPPGKSYPQPLPALHLQKSKFILYVGTAHGHKNLPALVDAYALLRKTRPELKLVLAGKKEIFHERLQAYIDKLGVDGVLMPGFVSDEQLIWLYQNCECYVFPSISEGFGLPGLEAMQNGAPVISSNATCLPEIYGDAALYFDPYDPAAMASAIESVLSAPKLRAKLVSSGHAQLKKYSWKKMAEQTLRVYRDLAS